MTDSFFPKHHVQEMPFESPSGKVGEGTILSIKYQLTGQERGEIEYRWISYLSCLLFLEMCDLVNLQLIYEFR